jgi:hypothetical protein
MTWAVPFKMQAGAGHEKSRRAGWLMRLDAKPDLEKMVWQAARGVHVSRGDEQDALKQ